MNSETRIRLLEERVAFLELMTQASAHELLNSIYSHGSRGK